MLPGLTLFFPCRNEAPHITPLLQDALRIGASVARDIEVLIIDDGSTDETAKRTDEFSRRDPRVRRISHATSQGYGAAIRSGITHARMPWIFFSDGDRQFDLNELPTLTRRSADADIVTGFREHRADPFHRRLNAWLFERAQQILFGYVVRDTNCAFKLIRRTVFDRITLLSSGALINAELFQKAHQHKMRVISLPVRHLPRSTGQQSGANLSVLWKAIQELKALRHEMSHS